MKKVVLLQHYFNEVGGIETFIINFCKTFSNQYDLTLVCRSIDYENALIVGEYANVICDPTETIECDICIVTSVLVDEEVFKHIRYKEIYQMIHSDWTEMRKYWNLKQKKYDENTKYISVSECARQSYLNEYGIDSVVIPNIITTDKPIKILRILSMTRLSVEKGYKRMCKLCDLFDKYNVPYIWDIYGTNPVGVKPYGNMILHNSIKRGNKLMTGYDYVCQLSDTESMCITMYESLMQGVPVLVTPFPNAKEEIKDGVNGYILPFDMNISEKDIYNIYQKIPNKVSYEQHGIEDLWKDILK